MLLVCIIIRYIGIPVLSDLCLYISPILLCKAGDVIKVNNNYWFIKQSFFIYDAVHIITVTAIGHIPKFAGDDKEK